MGLPVRDFILKRMESTAAKVLFLSGDNFDQAVGVFAAYHIKAVHSPDQYCAVDIGSVFLFPYSQLFHPGKACLPLKTATKIW
jgi:hypothetical protein